MSKAQFEGTAPMSAPRTLDGLEQAKVQATEDPSGKPIVKVSWAGGAFARIMDDRGDATNLAKGLTTVRLNQSILYRLGFRKVQHDPKAPGRKAGQARSQRRG